MSDQTTSQTIPSDRTAIDFSKAIVTGLSGMAAGPNKGVQYNDNGELAADESLEFDLATTTLSIGFPDTTVGRVQFFHSDHAFDTIIEESATQNRDFVIILPPRAPGIGDSLVVTAYAAGTVETEWDTSAGVTFPLQAPTNNDETIASYGCEDFVGSGMSIDSTGNVYFSLLEIIAFRMEPDEFTFRTELDTDFLKISTLGASPNQGVSVIASDAGMATPVSYNFDTREAIDPANTHTVWCSDGTPLAELTGEGKLQVQYLGIGNSEIASALPAVGAVFELFDAAGVSVGYVPIYATFTP